ncbi:LSM6-like protein, partial [Mya arenaria]
EENTAYMPSPNIHSLSAPVLMSRKQTPSEFLKKIIGRPVVVKLNSGVDYRGVLACLDGYMNIALEQTEEYVNGQLKNKYGDAFIRGNNVLYISTTKRRG